jgi:diguanylate cyclase (GGDEF)-like protein/PAS domain S-box-containing protein
MFFRYRQTPGSALVWPMDEMTPDRNAPMPAAREKSGWSPFSNLGSSRKADTMRQSRTRLAESFEESGAGWFWATDENLALTYVSRRIAERIGKDQKQLVGRPVHELFDPRASEARQDGRTLSFILSRKGKFSGVEVCAAGTDSECWWSISGVPELDSGSNFLGYLGSGFDVTTNRQSQREASRLAMSDTLTGLANRHKMSERLETLLHQCRATQRSCALLMLDLDRFKQVNDTLGHQAGDELLRQASQRLTRVVEDEWVLGRLGGDEFQIIIPDIDDRGVLGEAAQKIILMISQPYTIEGTRCVIGASVGVAVAPYDGISSEELTRSADLALYAAKNDGRGRYRFYSSELHDEAENRRQLEDDLRDAIAREELSLVYQPLVRTTTNRISGFEALMRWEHPQRGPISPGEFIPIAEDTGLISDLGNWALRRACRDAASWGGEARVAVNVSPIQFADVQFSKTVKAVLAETGLQPERLELEITESVFLGEGADTSAMFDALKKLNVRLALDDFGTGYSSLGYLQKAPFDKIKIDQGFVRGATEKGNRNAALITAIVSLAGALDMETTAEGIETIDTLELIRNLGVSHVQGYVYSRPLSHDDIIDRMERGELELKPSGPAVQRADRKRLFRKVGLIHEDHRYEVMMRDLSATGAMVEGLLDVPVGTQFVLDFGEGQLIVATVRRSSGYRQGIEFEVPLISDGSNGLCTRHRISPYDLATAGMPLAALPRGYYPLVGSGVGAANDGKGLTMPMFAQVDLTTKDALGRVA